MESDGTGATIAELMERMESDTEYFHGSDPVVEILIQRFRGILPTLVKSAQNNEIRQHYEQGLKCCRLARRIRLRLRNPRKVHAQQRSEIARLFRDAVESFNTNLEFTAREKEELL